jgi:hypothetical protein
MRALLAGEKLDFAARTNRTDKARLYSPARPEFAIWMSPAARSPATLAPHRDGSS